MDKKAGLVAFFDILGYQNFLERNDPEIAAEKIAELLRKLKTFQSETCLNSLEENKLRPLAKPIIEKIVSLVISDTILLILETDRRSKEYHLSRHLFSYYCGRLLKELFIYGLPVRGSIQYGEYVLVENQLLVGRPLVDAYQAAINLDLSACQVGESVTAGKSQSKHPIYVEYTTPLKTGEEKELVLLSPFTFQDNDKDEFTLDKIPDLGQFVIGSFCAHGKMISKEVQKKISNTEFFLKFCKARLMEKEIIRVSS